MNELNKKREREEANLNYKFVCCCGVALASETAFLLFVLASYLLYHCYVISEDFLFSFSQNVRNQKM